MDGSNVLLETMILCVSEAGHDVQWNGLSMMVVQRFWWRAK